MTTDVDVTARLPLPAEAGGAVGGQAEPPAEPDPTLRMDAKALRRERRRAARAARRVARGGAADIMYVLCLMQVGFTMLAAVGEQLLMGGNPLYLVVPAVKSVLLLVVGAKVVS